MPAPRKSRLDLIDVVLTAHASAVIATHLPCRPRGPARQARNTILGRVVASHVALGRSAVGWPVVTSGSELRFVSFKSWSCCPDRPVGAACGR